MNKNLYTLGIFILGLTVAAGFLNSAIYFLIGRGIVLDGYMELMPKEKAI